MVYSEYGTVDCRILVIWFQANFASCNSPKNISLRYSKTLCLKVWAYYILIVHITFIILKRQVKWTHRNSTKGVKMRIMAAGRAGILGSSAVSCSVTVSLRLLIETQRETSRRSRRDCGSSSTMIPFTDSESTLASLLNWI